MDGTLDKGDFFSMIILLYYFQQSKAIFMQYSRNHNLQNVVLILAV